MSEKPDSSARDASENHSRRSFLAEAVTASCLASGLGDWNVASAGETKGGAAVNPRLFTFVGGKTGVWSVTSNKTVLGEGLLAVERLDIVNGAVAPLPDGARWVLRGVTSNERYVTRLEKEQLLKKQVNLGRSEVTLGALIPIRKNAKWWALTQDERRAVLEDRSHHIEKGLKYLPAVARRLHHCRDLSDSEPFDFLTLFDYAKTDSQAFEELVAALRGTEEWKYVDREVDIRLEKVKS